MSAQGTGGPGRGRSVRTGARTGVGRTVGAWLILVVLAVALATTVATVVLALAPATWLLAALVAAAVATVVVPRSHAATVMLALVVVAVFGADGPGWWLPPLVLGAHATHVGASVAATVPRVADVEVAAVTPSVRRFVIVQAVAQVTVLLVLLLETLSG